LFGTICYLTYGANMDEQVITEMLPAGNAVVILLKLTFAVCVICTFPITINPCNIIIENCISSLIDRPSYSRAVRHYLKNLSRFLVCLALVILAVMLAEKLDKFLSLLGALLCAPLALTMPALLHLRLLAKTQKERFIDFALIAISLSALVFCVTQTLLQW